eukprot:CAMPEP_0170548618 /NCGR_PEP_ID=MMETSP0211-20121228/6883_1 /TAXON_ID=311385 /ORGANISM="Pseudokeronopsis sp., Strain OXSARD2" /LENGTH=60 /DNA_ID=CAMNT_0010854229 /DNA_START=68 /DNA_END=250 /DNA_ORIENTATION=+
MEALTQCFLQSNNDLQPLKPHRETDSDQQGAMTGQWTTFWRWLRIKTAWSYGSDTECRTK